MSRLRQLLQWLWLRLPQSLRKHPAMRRVRERFGPARTVRIVRTLDELDVELRELDRLAAISENELRAGFDRFVMELDLDMPADPWSDGYRAKVFELYEWLAGRAYSPSNEVTAFDVADAVARPFPYRTGSAETVGDHLIGVAHLLRCLDLPPGSRILELGCGWGNTTLALAQMGHHVTAVDIEPNFVKLVAARASGLGLSVDAREGDFALIDDLEPGFDAVVFFESFHHAADHLGLLASLDRVVAPGGRVLFAAEPILDTFPNPWGLRMDGQSLWAIRTNGWLELGFRTDYFTRTLARYGWTSEQRVQEGTSAGVIYVARRS